MNTKLSGDMSMSDVLLPILFRYMLLLQLSWFPTMPVMEAWDQTTNINIERKKKS